MFGIISYFAGTYYLSYQVVNGTELKTCESVVKSRARIIHVILLAQLVVQPLVTRNLGAAELRLGKKYFPPPLEATYYVTYYGSILSVVIT